MAAPVLNQTPAAPVGGPAPASPGNLASPLSVAGSAFGAGSQLYGNTQNSLNSLANHYGAGVSRVTAGYGALGANNLVGERSLANQQLGMLGLNKPGSWGYLSPAVQGIQNNLAQQEAQNQSYLSSGGLGASTVLNSMNSGPQQQAQFALNNLNMQRVQMGAGILGQTVGQGLQNQYGAGMAGLGFAGQALNNQYGYGLQGLGMLNQQAMQPYGMYGSFMSPYLQQQGMNQQMQAAMMQRGQPMQPGGPGPGFSAGGGGPGVGSVPVATGGYPSNYGGGNPAHPASNYGAGLPGSSGSYTIPGYSPSVVTPEATAGLGTYGDPEESEGAA